MLALRKGAAGLAVLMVSLVPLRLPSQETSSSLYGQAASAMLNRSFPSPRVEYLLLDLPSQQTLAVRWAHVERPIPAGSLLKPFVALAYGELHGDSGSPASKRQFPVLRCRGKGDGCWRAGGHGSMALEQALAESCNAYFLALARDLSASGADSGFSEGLTAMGRVSASYGLPAPPSAGYVSGSGEQRIPRMLIGVTPEWRISPVALANAYAKLASQPRSDLARRLLSGMRLAAGPHGTAAKIGPHLGGALAKTGTAPSVASREAGADQCVANGDGLVVALTPAENPRLLLLVRQRGTTGALAAEVAGRMLSRLEESHAPAR
jgi:cell division protein FtsI/penicillin-binding protein 2